MGHYRQHLNYAAAFAAQTPAIYIADHPLLRLGEGKEEQKTWLQDHYEIHQAIRGYTGISGINLAEVDMTKDEEFQSWLDDHAAEHMAIDAALGLT